jgi:hypothetical protein
VLEEGLDVLCAELAWLPSTVEGDEAANPGKVGLLGAGIRV